MAIETLNNVNEIGGFGVTHLTGSDTIGTFDNHIIIDHDVNCIGFRLQKGPIQEVGANGCQIDTMILACLKIIEGLNSQYPCYENVGVIQGLKDALSWLEQRRLDREQRNVEGKNES